MDASTQADWSIAASDAMMAMLLASIEIKRREGIFRRGLSGRQPVPAEVQQVGSIMEHELGHAMKHVR